MANAKLSDNDISWVEDLKFLIYIKSIVTVTENLFFDHSRKTYGRKASLEDINLDQFLKISNYEETIKQLDIYYGIVKRQLLQNQSEITGLFPVLSTDKDVHIIYCGSKRTQNNISSIFRSEASEVDRRLKTLLICC